MEYYAIQVKTRGEDKFMRLFNALHPQAGFPCIFPGGASTYGAKA
jgi:hypothetical protein